jgi:hypothetical protein
MILLGWGQGVRLAIAVVHVSTAAGIEEAVIPAAIWIVESPGPAIGPALIEVGRASVIAVGICR